MGLTAPVRVVTLFYMLADPPLSAGEPKGIATMATAELKDRELTEAAQPDAPQAVDQQQVVTPDDAQAETAPLLAAAVHLYRDGIYSHSRPEVMTPRGACRFAETYNDAKGKYVAVAREVDLAADVPQHLGAETFATTVRIVHIMRDGKYKRTLPHVFDEEGGNEYVRRFNETSEGTGVVAVLTEHVVGGTVPVGDEGEPGTSNAGSAIACKKPDDPTEAEADAELVSALDSATTEAERHTARDQWTRKKMWREDEAALREAGHDTAIIGQAYWALYELLDEYFPGDDGMVSPASPAACDPYRIHVHTGEADVYLDAQHVNIVEAFAGELRRIGELNIDVGRAIHGEPNREAKERQGTRTDIPEKVPEGSAGD